LPAGPPKEITNMHSTSNGLNGQAAAVRDLLSELIETIPTPIVRGINPEEPAGAIAAELRMQLGHRRASIVCTKLRRILIYENLAARDERKARLAMLDAAD
jgi:hypothetical protein